MRADRSTHNGTQALLLTHGCLETLALGQTPTWEKYRSRPGDPTPIYDETATALGYEHDAIPRVLPALSRALLTRVPIPSRPLSYRAAARRTDPQTSHQAARSVNITSPAHQRILHIFTEHGPQSDQDLIYQWGLHTVTHDWDRISPSGLRSRRKELVDAGLIVASDRAGRTASGRACIVWRLA